jgi:hypothetical protein
MLPGADIFRRCRMQCVEVRGKKYERKEWNWGQKETETDTFGAVFLDGILVGKRTVVMGWLSRK